MSVWMLGVQSSSYTYSLSGNVMPAADIPRWPAGCCTEPISLSVQLAGYQAAEITIQTRYSHANVELSLWAWLSISATRLSAGLPVHFSTHITGSRLAASKASVFFPFCLTLHFTHASICLLCFCQMEYQCIINDLILLYLPINVSTWWPQWLHVKLGFTTTVKQEGWLGFLFTCY